MDCLPVGWEHTPMYGVVGRLWYRRMVLDGRRPPLLLTVRDDGKWEVRRLGSLPEPNTFWRPPEEPARGQSATCLDAMHAAAEKVLRGR